MRTAVITVDAVLRDAETTGFIPLGQALYRVMAEGWNLVLVADQDIEPVWLLVNGYDLHQDVVARRPDDPEPAPARRVRQIERLRGLGIDVALLVDPDPAVVAEVSRLGVTCLLFVDPTFARPEFRPDFKETVTPWADLVSQIERDRALRAADKRFEEDPH